MNLESLTDAELIELHKTTSKTISKYTTIQKSTKININSLYGVVGTNSFRFYSIANAEAITLTGQYIILWIQQEINKFLNKVAGTEGVDFCIASDTDSVFLNMSTIVDKYVGSNIGTSKGVDFLDAASKNSIEPFIEKKIEELTEYLNSHQNAIEMARDVIADTGIWTAKKRYCLNVHDCEGTRYATPELKIMGIEVQRSSTPKICRDKLKDCIRIMLTGTEDMLIEYIDEFKSQYFSLPPESIACPRSVQNLEKYTDTAKIYSKGTPIAVKGSLLHNHLITENDLDNVHRTIISGEKIKFLYLKQVNPTRINVISFPNVLPVEFGLHDYVDYELQFEKTFLDPLKNIANTIGWKFERTNSLLGFFG